MSTLPEVDKLPPLPAEADATPLAAAVAQLEPARQAGITPPSVRRAISRQSDAVTRLGDISLEPFTLDHQLLLEEINHPLVVPGRNPTATDFSVFCYVCQNADNAWDVFTKDGAAELLAQARKLRVLRGITASEAIAVLVPYITPDLPDSPGKATGQAATP